MHFILKSVFLHSLLSFLFNKYEQTKIFSLKRNILLSLLVFFFPFCLFSPDVFGDDDSCVLNPDSTVCKERERRAEQRFKNEQEDRQGRIEDREREALRREARGKQEAQREAARLQREAMRERERKCEQAERDMKTDMEKQNQKQKDSKQKFFDLEEKITDLERTARENKEKISTELDTLKTESSQTIQEFKDDMGDELKEIDDEIKKMEGDMAQLHDALDTVATGRLDAFFARRKQQNEFYSKCFGQALQQTEQQRGDWYKRKATGTLKRKSMEALVSGGKTQTKSQFSQKFNSLLHLCLNNQAALLEKENQKNEYKLMLEKLRRKEEKAKQQIAGLKVQIQQMKTQGKVETMSKFKEKMQAELQNFETSYTNLTTNFKEQSQQVIKEIKKIKEQQASVLMEHSQTTSQDTRTIMAQNGCGGMDNFNLFPTNNPGTIPSLSFPSGSLQ